MSITNKDVEKLSGIFATKDDLNNFREEILIKVNDSISNSQDKIIKKLEDMSIEQKMAFSQYRRQEEKLENHESRIKVLEDKVLTS